MIQSDVGSIPVKSPSVILIYLLFIQTNSEKVFTAFPFVPVYLTLTCFTLFHQQYISVLNKTGMR